MMFRQMWGGCEERVLVELDFYAVNVRERSGRARGEVRGRREGGSRDMGRVCEEDGGGKTLLRRRRERSWPQGSVRGFS